MTRGRVPRSPHRFATSALSFALCIVGCAGPATVPPSPTEEPPPAPPSETDVAVPAATSAFPPDAELLELVKARVAEHRAVGVVLGLREADGSHRIVAHGDAGPGALPLGPKSVFEIGSITKAFTGILLAEMAGRGELKLEDPVQLHAHAGVTIPRRGNQEMRLVDLSTHSSGLPRMPDNFELANPTNPYVDYSVDDLHRYLTGHTLTRDIGAETEYSNLGAGLLGHILAKVNGSDYETLVKARILQPLGMTMTGVTLTPEMRKNLALGHDESGEVVPNWDVPTFAGAGALRSNADDMLAFLDANLREPSTPLEAAMRSSQQARRKWGSSMEIGLNWVMRTTESHRIVGHDGGTGGYRSFIGFDPDRGVGVVVLLNSMHDASDIGFHLLDPSLPLTKARVLPEEIEVPRDVLATYVGVYQLAPEIQIAVTLEEGGLHVKGTGHPKHPIFASAPDEFFLKAIDRRATFVRDGSGAVTELVWEGGGARRTAPRVE